MNEAVKEIRKELRNLFNRNAWLKWAVYIFVLFALTLIAKIIFFPSIEKGIIGGSGTPEWEQINDYYDGEEVEFEFDISETENVINRFFISANRNDVDRFVSLLDEDINTSDFLEKADMYDERLKLYEDALKRLSRNGSIEKLEVVDGNKMLGGKLRVIVKVYYRDLEAPIQIPLILQLREDILSVSDYTGEVNEEQQIEYKQYYVSTSVWDMIEVIESGGE